LADFVDYGDEALDVGGLEEAVGPFGGGLEEAVGPFGGGLEEAVGPFGGDVGVGGFVETEVTPV
jgi:hypothetical protein